MEVLYVQAMLKYKLAIFDLDGTLSDSFPWFLRVINSVADKHGFRRVEDHDIDTLRGKSSREIVKFMNVPYWRLPAIARDVRRMKSEALTDIPLFPGVDRMLRKLSDKGVVLAVVSSDSAIQCQNGAWRQCRADVSLCLRCVAVRKGRKF